MNIMSYITAHFIIAFVLIDLLSSENSVKKILNPSRDRILETGKFLYEIEKEREKLKLQWKKLHVKT